MTPKNRICQNFKNLLIAGCVIFLLSDRCSSHSCLKLIQACAVLNS